MAVSWWTHYVDRFIRHALRNHYARVRCAVERMLRSRLSKNLRAALGQFLRPAEPRGNQTSEDCFLVTHYVDRFIRHALRNHYVRVPVRRRADVTVETT